MQLMGRHADLKRTELRNRDSRIFPGWSVPVMIWEDDKRVIKPMRYGCRPAGKQLQKEGLQYSSIRMRDKESFSERIVFPGALVTFRDKTVPVQLLKTQLRTPDADIVNRSINNLEYELASAFRQSTQRDKSRIAFLEGHGELRDMEVADITNALSELYDVKSVRLDEKLDALSHKVPNMSYRLNDYDAIIVAKPDSTFSPREAYILDQFIMNGGKALWLIDPMNANLDSLRKNQFSIAVAKDLGLDDLFFSYGVRLLHWPRGDSA